MSQKYKKHNHCPGIYTITNKVNGKQYVGSSHRVSSRMIGHIDILLKGDNNELIQEDWDIFGYDNFYFRIIELCNEEERFIREQYWTDTLNTMHPNGYNKQNSHAKTAKSKPLYYLSQEAKDRLSEERKGEKNPMYGKIGPNNPMTKLPVNTALEILSKVNKGEYTSIRALAKEYNISPSAIAQMKKGIHWVNKI